MASAQPSYKQSRPLSPDFAVSLCMSPALHLRLSCSLSPIDYFSTVFLLSITLFPFPALSLKSKFSSHLTCFAAAAHRLHFFPFLHSCHLHTRARQRWSIQPFDPGDLLLEICSQQIRERQKTFIQGCSSRYYILIVQN